MEQNTKKEKDTKQKNYTTEKNNAANKKQAKNLNVKTKMRQIYRALVTYTYLRL